MSTEIDGDAGSLSLAVQQTHEGYPDRSMLTSWVRLAMPGQTAHELWVVGQGRQDARTSERQAASLSGRK